MAESSIPVDLFNPGQVFACLGLAEAADSLLGPAEGAFDWSSGPGTRFLLRARGDTEPVRAVLEFLAGAEVTSVAPLGSANRTEKWKVRTELTPERGAFPLPDPPGPDKLPACLTATYHGVPHQLVIDHWGDGTERDSFKLWAGSGGYPGAAIARDALALVRDQCVESAADPFSLAAEQSSSFRFDWRRDYVPLDLGFSLNNHTSISAVGYPLVELLAALGLGNARPERLERLRYRYGVLGLLPDGGLFRPSLLRAGLGATKLPFPRRAFLMQLGWPGKEGQARAITSVTEEKT